MSDDTSWGELRLPAERAAQDTVLLDVLKPLLASSEAVFLLRDQQAQRPFLRIWVHQDRLADLHGRLGDHDGVTMLPRSSFTVDDSPYTGPRIAGFWHGFLAEATALLVGQLAEIAAGQRSRLAVAIDTVVAHLPAVDFAKTFAQRYPPSAANFAFPVPFPALRSHSDGIIVMSRDPAAARAQMEAMYAPASAKIERRTAAILNQLDGTGPTISESPTQWYELARKYLLLADAELSSGGITVIWEDGWVGDEWDLSPSSFHQVVQDRPAFQNFLRTDSGYQAMRIMMTALYLYLNALGLRTVDRFFACHAISRACESIFDVDATAVMARLARLFAGRL